MTAWHETITQPPEENMARTSRHGGWAGFVKAGTDLADTVTTELKKAFEGGLKGLKILDFGCGCGRVAMPLFYNTGGALTHACDIDASATEYLGSVLDQVDCRTTPFKPPLPYDDNTFDAIYSISIWTHLTEEDQKAWLREMQRIMRPGGILIVSTGGWTAISSRQNSQAIKSWQGVTQEQFEAEGFMFRESETLHHEGHKKKYFPGITDSYGQTSNTRAYIEAHWSEFFDVLDHVVDAFVVQDMVVMRKR